MKNSASSDAGPGMMSGAGMGMMGMGGAGGGIPAAPPRAADPRSRGAGAAPRSDPRAVAAPPAPPPPRADPRAARMDPRAAARSVPPPPPPPPVRSAPLSQQYGGVPQQPPGPPGVTNLDPALVQQVMLLTPQQISQLPPDKQQSIMALRQQISGNRM
uniref:Transcription termination and cleavage factor C-terminal domain-containing protein n=1 Tax=Craspedostauros australis TaxID=1486917 RepID=A0A7R9ZJU1_9STRA|mmetsp:Transcript_16073/g.44517  ORF Transcript_16073/g.44517 Transcript_16073/m.44517 type:complete len:158 (+) Transcript_16073:1-474(+)